jgi:hypothetical protein
MMTDIGNLPCYEGSHRLYRNQTQTSIGNSAVIAELTDWVT